MTTINNVKVNFIAKAEMISEARKSLNNAISEAWSTEILKDDEVRAELHDALIESDKLYEEQIRSIDNAHSDIREVMTDYTRNSITNVMFNPKTKKLYISTFKKYGVEVPSNIYSIGDKVKILEGIFRDARIEAIDERNRREYKINANSGRKYNAIRKERSNRVGEAEKTFNSVMSDIEVRYSEYDVMDCTYMMIA